MNKLSSSNIDQYTLGTWMFGGDMQRDPDNDDEADIEAVKMHLNYGVKSIFTAQNYAEGWAEKLTGEGIKSHPRTEITLTTAIRKENSAYDDMLRSMEESLERLQVDYVDIIMHHAPLPNVPIEESIKGLNAIVEKGMARGIAVSNYNSDSMQKALAVTNNPILFNQTYYNLNIREVEEDGVLELCQNNGVLIQAFRPLEFGELANSKNELLLELAEKYSLTPAGLCLAWLTSQLGVIVVATTHKLEHLQENLAAIKVKLTVEDIERLRKEFPYDRDHKPWIR